MAFPSSMSPTGYRDALRFFIYTVDYSFSDCLLLRPAKFGEVEIISGVEKSKNTSHDQTVHFRTSSCHLIQIISLVAGTGKTKQKNFPGISRCEFLLCLLRFTVWWRWILLSFFFLYLLGLVKTLNADLHLMIEEVLPKAAVLAPAMAGLAAVAWIMKARKKMHYAFQWKTFQIEAALLLFLNVVHLFMYRGVL